MTFAALVRILAKEDVRACDRAVFADDVGLVPSVEMVWFECRDRGIGGLPMAGIEDQQVAGVGVVASSEEEDAIPQPRLGLDLRAVDALDIRCELRVGDLVGAEDPVGENGNSSRFGPLLMQELADLLEALVPSREARSPQPGSALMRLSSRRSAMLPQAPLPGRRPTRSAP